MLPIPSTEWGVINSLADVVVWYCLRHHHQPRQLGEETIVVPYELLSFHIEPRDFLDGTRMLQRTCEKPLADALTIPASS